MKRNRPHPWHISGSFGLAVFALSAVLHAQSFDTTDLTLGQPVSDTIRTPGEIRYYYLNMAAQKHLYVTADKPAGWNSTLTLRFGTTQLHQVSGVTDLALDRSSTVAGNYYVAMGSAQNQTGSYTLLADTLLPELVPGDSRVGRLDGAWDVKWYQVPVGTGKHLFVSLDKPQDWQASLALRRDSVVAAAAKSSQSASDQFLDIGRTSSRTYVSIGSANSEVGDFVVTADTILPAIAFGDSVIDALNGSWDVRWFQLSMPANPHMFLNLEKDRSWQSVLTVKRDSITGPALKSSTSASDQFLDAIHFVGVPYYVEVRSANLETGAFVLGLDTALDRLPPGSSDSAALAGSWDVKVYQVPMQAGRHLYLTLSKSVPWNSELTVTFDSLSGNPLGQARGDTGASFDIPAPRTGNYCVRIQSGGSGAFGAFRLAAQDIPLVLLQPNGGEQLFIGRRYRIAWHSLDSVTPLVRIEYSTDDFRQIRQLVADSVPNTGAFYWTVPEPETDSGRIRLLVCGDTSRFIAGRDYFRVRHQPLPDGMTRYWAVLIGISDYASSKLADLAGCRGDAVALDTLLRTYDNWDTSARIRTVTDNAATGAQIEASITDMGNMCDGDDVLLVFFSGYGSADSVRQFICPYEAALDSPSTWIGADEFSGWLSGCLTSNIIVILDAGFTGQAADDSLADKRLHEHYRTGRTGLHPRVTFDSTLDRCCYLAACQDTECAFADLGETGNSCFTAGMVAGLAQHPLADSGRITAAALLDLAAPRTAALAAFEGRPQHPRLASNSGGDLIVAVRQPHPAAWLDSVHCYPNPFDARAGHASVTFAGLTTQSRIRIYDCSGLLVFDVEANSTNGTWTWNVQNRAGADLARGVYTYVITDIADGSGAVRVGKLGVLR